MDAGWWSAQKWLYSVSSKQQKCVGARWVKPVEVGVGGGLSSMRMTDLDQPYGDCSCSVSSSLFTVKFVLTNVCFITLNLWYKWCGNLHVGPHILQWGCWSEQTCGSRWSRPRLFITADRLLVQRLPPSLTIDEGAEWRGSMTHNSGSAHPPPPRRSPEGLTSVTGLSLVMSRCWGTSLVAVVECAGTDFY